MHTLKARVALWTLPFLAAVVFLGQAAAQQNKPPALTRVGEPHRVCQLTGDVDWESGKPTPGRTLTRYGLDAVDLGYPVEHNGKLIFLFGDSWPPTHGVGPLAEWTPDDSVGVTTRTEPPNAEACLDMTVHSRTVAGKPAYDPATITGPVKVKQGFFNVPSGGVSVKGALYAFFWTDHCWQPNTVQPDPGHPMQRPPATAHCPEKDDENSLGKSVLARSDDDGHTFTHVVEMPEGFAYVTAVNSHEAKGLPQEQRLGVYIFGVPRYRASVPYLAFAPIDTFADPGTWRFFDGLEPNGTPRVVDRAHWKPGPDKQIYIPAIAAGNDVGEFSVTWNEPLHMWLMTYTHIGAYLVLARVAPAPWGPWSDPAVLFSLADHPGCKEMMIPKGCGNRRDYWEPVHPHPPYTVGHFYAPFVINRYTHAEGGRRATIYWTLSPWNPYEVQIMRTTVELPEKIIILPPHLPIGLPPGFTPPGK